MRTILLSLTLALVACDPPTPPTPPTPASAPAPAAEPQVTIRVNEPAKPAPTPAPGDTLSFEVGPDGVRIDAKKK